MRYPEARDPTLYDELVCSVTGQDSTAMAHWLEQIADDVGHLCFRRCALHWKQCSEEEKSAIWMLLGLGPSPSGHVERFPVPKAIKVDYEECLKETSHWLGED